MNINQYFLSVHRWFSKLLTDYYCDIYNELTYKLNLLNTFLPG